MPQPRNQLTKMKINEISLVTSPASEGADVLFTKATDVSSEPRDERGRWTTSVSNLAGIAREHAKAISAHAQAIGTKVLARSGMAGSAIVSTRPTGARPIRGGGVQFDFQHTLAAGNRWNTSVQIRPEHLGALATGGWHAPKVETRLHRVAQRLGAPVRVLQRGLTVVEQMLRASGYGEVPQFGQYPRPPEKGFLGLFRRSQDAQTEEEKKEIEHKANVVATQEAFRRQNELRSAAGLSPLSALQDTRSTTPATRPFSSNSDIPSGMGWRTNSRFGFPEYHGATWSAPSNISSDPGGKDEIYNGHFIPSARKDVQEGIKRFHDWAALNPRKAAEAKVSLTKENAPTGGAFFTGQGDYVPPHTLARQNTFEQQYATARANKPAARLFPPGTTEETVRAQRDPGAELDEQFRAMFPVTRGPTKTAEGAGRAEDMEENAGTGRRSGSHILKSMFPGSDTVSIEKITHLPPGRARNALDATKLFGPENPNFAPRITKSGGSSLDYARRVAKSKIRRS